MESWLRLKATSEFTKWHESLTPGLRRRIAARFDNIRVGNFVNSRSLGEGLFELKWKIGMRVYFSRKRIRKRRLKNKYENELEEDAR